MRVSVTQYSLCHSLTFIAHVREGYSIHFVFHSVTPSAEDLEDWRLPGFENGIKVENSTI